MKSPKPPLTLLDQTLELLANRPKDLTLRQIAEGAKVDFEWLSKFSRELIDDPGVKKVQAVHDFMSSCRLAA